MGEWTLVPEARAIRPGQVTFVVVNRGKFAHGFRVRSESHGSHGGDRFEVRTRVLAPGQSAKLTVDLAPGTYRLECFVEDQHGDHGDLGMETTLVVSAKAPLVTTTPATSKPTSPTATIRAFAFKPASLVVKRGAMVKWVNEDAAPHTVSAANGSFSSKSLARGGTYVRKFTQPGTYTYLCALHPSMRGKVIVR